jgi:hypothetical protein
MRRCKHVSRSVLCKAPGGGVKRRRMPQLRPLPCRKPRRSACEAAMLPPVAYGTEPRTLSVRALLWLKHES